MALDPRIPLGVQPLKTGDIFVAAADRKREEEERRQRMQQRELQMKATRQGMEQQNTLFDQDQQDRQDLQYFHKAAQIDVLLQEAKHVEAQQVLQSEIKKLMESGEDPETVAELQGWGRMIMEEPIKAANQWHDRIMPELESKYGEIVAQSLKNKQPQENGQMSPFSQGAGRIIVDTANGNKQVGVMQTNNQGAPRYYMNNGEQMDSLPDNLQVVDSARFAEMQSTTTQGSLPARTMISQQEEDAESSSADRLAREEYQRNLEFTVGQNTERLQQAEQKHQMMTDWIGSARGKAGGFTTGLLGAVGRLIPGTEAYDLASTLESIKANVGFNELQQMRDASPTGGALGQVTEREIAFLQALLGNLDQAQSQAQFVSNLDQLQSALDVIVNRGTEEFNRLYPDQQRNSQTTTNAPNAAGSGQSRLDVLLQKLDNDDLTPEEEDELNGLL